MAVTIYGIKNCDTMKKARTWLDDNKVAYTFHDYKTAGIDAKDIQASAIKVVTERGNVYLMGRVTEREAVRADHGVPQSRPARQLPQPCTFHCCHKSDRFHVGSFSEKTKAGISLSRHRLSVIHPVTSGPPASSRRSTSSGSSVPRRTMASSRSSSARRSRPTIRSSPKRSIPFPTSPPSRRSPSPPPRGLNVSHIFLAGHRAPIGSPFEDATGGGTPGFDSTA